MAHEADIIAAYYTGMIYACDVITLLEQNLTLCMGIHCPPHYKRISACYYTLIISAFGSALTTTTGMEHIFLVGSGRERYMRL